MIRVRGNYQADFEKQQISLTSFYPCSCTSEGADVFAPNHACITARQLSN